ENSKAAVSVWCRGLLALRQFSNCLEVIVEILRFTYRRERAYAIVLNFKGNAIIVDEPSNFDGGPV
ncbi:MAG: hypothetical protein ABI298_00845, partial [Acidimicrobiales bacterium]